MSVARQIHGEWVFVQTQRAFETEEKANDFLYVLKAQYTKDGNAVPVTLKTEHGEVSCHCELGVFEVELEKGEI